MITQFEFACALMAGHCYQTNRSASEINWLPIPSGWLEVQHVPNPIALTYGGFEMSVFQSEVNSNDIVISFAGTNPTELGDWTSGNVPLALGVVSDQLKQAVDYYLKFKAANPNANITFTGHSLGGGIAALMGVFFGMQAVTFDQAPFAKTAAQGLFGTPSGAIDLQTYLLGKTYTDPVMAATRDAAVADLGTFLTSQQANGGIPNSDLVSTYRVAGEFTSSGIVGTLFNPIGPTATWLQHGLTSASSFTELHDMALLTAFLQSQQTAATGMALNDVTFKLTELLGMIFDPKLYAYSTGKANDKNVNYLENIVRHQAGDVGGLPIGGDAMVTRFTKDLWKLAQNGGLTLHDGSSLNTSQNELSKTLMAFAMQKYYEETSTSAGYKKELFAPVTGGIQFDMADVSKTFATAIANNAKLNLADAKGVDLYLKNYLAQSSFTDAERQLILSVLPYQRDWYVQAGVSGLATTDALNRGAFMLGGSGSDALVGGSAADLLVGNAGDDVLMGGTGNDTLLGGKGNDTYVFQSGDGLDTILDSDGQGSIVYDGVTLADGAQYGDARVHRDASGHLYVDVGSSSLVIDGNIVIERQQAGNDSTFVSSFERKAA
jgi:RTX calcium-binding nonapeptide repeat (4 copies)/Lipase (class 3)